MDSVFKNCFFFFFGSASEAVERSSISAMVVAQSRRADSVSSGPHGIVLSGEFLAYDTVVVREGIEVPNLVESVRRIGLNVSWVLKRVASAFHAELVSSSARALFRAAEYCFARVWSDLEAALLSFASGLFRSQDVPSWLVCREQRKQLVALLFAVAEILSIREWANPQHLNSADLCRSCCGA